MSNRPGPLAQRIAAEIRAELGRQNRSRRWLAEQMGQSHVTVSRWVNGDGPMSLDALDAICEVLGITVADLLVRVEQNEGVPTPRPPRTRRNARGGAPVVDFRAPDNTQWSGRDNHQFGPLSAQLAAA